MNQIEKLFEIGDYEKYPLGGKQRIRDRYIVVTDTDGKTVAVRLPSVEEPKDDNTDVISQPVIRTCDMCVFFNCDKYLSNSFCSIRKIINPSNPSFYFRKPQEKSCGQFTQLQENN